jgi:HSP20 family protein
VTVHDGRLIVSGERKHEKSREHDGALLRELRYGSFRRELVLPAGTTAGQVHASYEAGILTVRVQGAVPVKPEPVRVPVETGAAPEKTLEAGGEQPPN